MSKAYKVYKAPNDRLKQMIFGRLGRRYYEEFLALDNVSFEIEKGETVGVIGRNGSGKSTTLQIIAGTVKPTKGSVKVNGRVAALLELGSGFNPEFTGKENVYLNAAIYGLTSQEIDEKYDEIVSFADIGDFINQPVKTYSSGMFVRLAFSVAIHTNPDILIIDEALSVGDALFQHKCISRIKKMVRDGVTLFFVSHSPDAIRSLCTKGIWLEHGKVRMIDTATKVSNLYFNEVLLEQNRLIIEGYEEDMEQVDTSNEQQTSIYEEAKHEIKNPEFIEVKSVKILNSHGKYVEALEQGENFEIEVIVLSKIELSNISIGIVLKDQYGIDLTGESIFNKFRRGLSISANNYITVRFRSQMLLRGGESYSVNLRINQVSKWDRSDNVHIYNDETACVFRVIADLENPMWFKYKQDFEVAVDVN